LALLAAQHQSSGASLTVTAAPLPTPFGVLEMDEQGRVSDFREGGELEDHWVNVGVYVMDRDIVSLLPERGDAEHELFPELAEQGRLWAYRHDGIWLTMNTKKDLDRIQSFFESVSYPKNPWAQRRGPVEEDASRLREKAKGAVKSATDALKKPMPLQTDVSLSDQLAPVG
jgi:NDP-sugar pyrophosphorylase family protein